MKKTFVAACCFVVATALSGVASAQDIFIKIAGIEGTSAAEGRSEWTEATSMSEGVSVPPGTAMGRSSKAAFAPVTLTKKLDAGTIKLREAAASGATIKQVEIEVMQAGQKTTVAYRVVLTDVIVQSVNTSTASGSSLIGEEALTLGFSEIRWEFTPTEAKTGKPKTTVKGGWSVKTNAKL